MSGFFDLVKPETTITLGFIGLMLATAVFLVVKGLFIPRSTHLRELKSLTDRVADAVQDRDARVAAISADRALQVESIRSEMTTRMDNFRSDHAIRIEQMIAAHEREVTGLRADREIMLASKQRDADDWRTAYHIGAENAKTSEDRMDEVLETVRLTYAALNALRTIAAGRNPELPPGGQS